MLLPHHSGFYQCVGAMPTVLNVASPAGVDRYTWWARALLELPTKLGVEMFVPGSCLGGYHRRLVVGSLWPLALVLFVAVGSVSFDLARRFSKQGHSSIRSAVQGALWRTLPLVLVLTFILVPSTSSRIFSAFQCDSFAYDDASGQTREFLRADYSLDCDSDEYLSIRRDAYVFVAMRPIGVPLLYAVLLGASRRALFANKPTLLSNSIRFTVADYTTYAFWWEPLEVR